AEVAERVEHAFDRPVGHLAVIDRRALDVVLVDQAPGLPEDAEAPLEVGRLAHDRVRQHPGPLRRDAAGEAAPGQHQRAGNLAEGLPPPAVPAPHRSGFQVPGSKFQVPGPGWLPWNSEPGTWN